MDDERDIERLLIEMRPVLSVAVRDRIENDVIGARRLERRVPMVFRAAALAGGLAAVLLVLAVFGATPFGGENTDVRADQECTYIRTTVTAPQVLVVTDNDGHSKLSTRPAAIPGFVRRCR